MTKLLRQLTDTFVVGGLSGFALVLGLFSISYLNRRRQIVQQERMAALIKGLHRAGIGPDALVKPNADARDYVVRTRRRLGTGGPRHFNRPPAPAPRPKERPERPRFAAHI